VKLVTRHQHLLNAFAHKALIFNRNCGQIGQCLYEGQVTNNWTCPSLLLIDITQHQVGNDCTLVKYWNNNVKTLRIGSHHFHHRDILDVLQVSLDIDGVFVITYTIIKYASPSLILMKKNNGFFYAKLVFENVLK
jgi:hypothetical protein